jgi:dolichol-phosphate mannosyltransferase
MATWMGFVVSAVAFVLAIFYFITFFTMHKEAGLGFTTIIICVLFLGGVQLVCTGILGEYIGRIYEEIKQRPLYIVQETLGFETKS